MFNIWAYDLRSGSLAVNFVTCNLLAPKSAPKNSAKVHPFIHHPKKLTNGSNPGLRQIVFGESTSDLIGIPNLTKVLYPSAFLYPQCLTQLRQVAHRLALCVQKKLCKQQHTDKIFTVYFGVQRGISHYIFKVANSGRREVANPIACLFIGGSCAVLPFPAPFYFCSLYPGYGGVVPYWAYYFYSNASIFSNISESEPNKSVMPSGWRSELSELKLSHELLILFKIFADKKASSKNF